MKFYTILIVFSVLFFRCDFNRETDNRSKEGFAKAQDKARPITETKAFQEGILGIWVGHSSVNNTVILKKDSIFSFAWIAKAPYSIDSNSISIGEGAYYNRFLLSLRQDTLVFTDQDGKTLKYTWVGN
jgi:hypothetical protein